MAGVNLPTYMEEHEQQMRGGAPAAPAPPQKYVDPMQLHPLLSMPIPKGVEYMSVEDPQASAGWGDALMQQTGTAFLIAGGVGGFMGTLEGIKQTTGNPHMKLRVNGILNGMEKRGLMFANTAAAGVLTFHLLKKIVSLARGNDEDEAVNFIGSAAVVGGMMGAARGARPGIVGALIGATCGAIAYLGNHQLVPQLQ
eukprot:Phypoly_transcript_13740.p1 GENE.Phypoly_transcript_13740~~Phypoly_transcript_13740.p1  ORF type:complete len:197 (+),score=35.57 Phypoly_transcript_13740:393-983(+)